jgi:2-C-methyl-D-erythritol 4-phosphate cytidylyltransferase / 2-C-methyl-D-erythritol 2,4-cyclodiphosphate synthase
MATMKTVAIIVAAGAGLRAGGDLPKQFQLLEGKSVLRHTLEAFVRHPDIHTVITVIAQGFENHYAQAAVGLALPAAVIGGATRQESCALGIAAAKAMQPDAVLIHDAARPFVSSKIISDVIAKLLEAEAVIPALPVADTMKRAVAGKITQTLARDGLYFVQTPQGFDFDKIHAAHKALAAMGVNDLTDDAAVAEAMGMKVHIVAGDPANRKLTTTQDMQDANQKMNQLQNTETRVGQGVDFHTFTMGHSIWLCGVEIPHSYSLLGHSDADVALHAITDALLGAIGEADIGTHFPPSDPQWKNAKSAIFVAKAVSLIKKRGGEIGNVDVTILAEAPKISPHLAAMKAALSHMLAIATDRIAIKATTTEQMGAIGRKEGMAALATATVRLPL